MYNIIYLIILFIFILSILLLNLPKLESTDYLYQKLYIFVSVFFFQVIIGLADSIYRGCAVDLKKLGQNALIDSLIAVIGLAIYQDMMNSDHKWTNYISSPTHEKLMITIIIVFFITTKKFLFMLFENNTQCINN